ncbi:hypothetical protein AB0N81_12885 [Streptomyces sp. NPDC093510]|uniref:hypothetical protein n=1 Tax=Streptomyces sp. NPDC093510 TaxID=3155199 RepID=UPI00343D606A
MIRPGWTMEQQEGIRFYTRILNTFALLGVVLFTIMTLTTGKPRGWVMVAAVILFWAGITFFMRRMKKGQP